MIVIVVTFLTATGPLGTLRSVATFETRKSCEFAVQAETPRYRAMRGRLAGRLGAEVSFDARCVDLTPGVPA